MHRLIKPIFWTFLFLVMMLVIDQLLVQVPPMHPAHAAISNFYRDFRGRLIDLAFNEKQAEPETIEAVIERQQKQKKPTTVKSSKPDPQPSTPASKPKVAKAQRYVYSDDQGELNFTDSLNEVPEKYRDQAQPMSNGEGQDK